MTKDTEKMLIDKELNEVSGGFYYKEKLSGKDIDKLCNKIDQLNVDSATKRSAILFVNCSGGNFRMIEQYLHSLADSDYKWVDIYVYFMNLARTE